MEVCSRHIYDEPTNDDLIGFDHRLGEKLGQGSYGIIFEGTNATTNKSVAIKFESCNAEIPQLQREYNVYLDLHGLKGIPNIYYFGMEGNDYCMIMDLLGPSLEDLFEMCGKRFSIKTVACVGKEMVSLIQSVHERHYIYRDIKPDNFLIGDPNDHLTKNHLHLIDFGMSKRYRDPTTHRHYPYKECKSLTGTARYMSINTHLGKEQSRRDDLESLCHVLFYFLRGSLPWQGLKASSQKERYIKICENKQNMDPFILCDDFPEQFATLLKYARSLRFDETPDYDYCRELLDNILTEIDEVDDGIRDWMLINNGRGWEVNGRKRPKKQLLLMPY